MESLFTPEVISSFLEMLKGAADGSVTVLVVYFLLPLMMLLVASLSWLAFAYYLIKNLSKVLLKRLDRAKINLTRLDIKDSFITIDGTPALFCDLVDSIKGDTYIHDTDVKWLQKAVKNQKHLDKELRRSRYSPADITTGYKIQRKVD